MLGCSMANHMRTELVLDVLDMAITPRRSRRRRDSSRGSPQYTFNDYLDH